MKFNQQKFKADKLGLILENTKQGRVLDVGAIGQDKGLVSDDWIHGKLARIVTHLVGVDINERGVSEAKSKGFNILLPHELKDEKFDVLLMLDVVEHVDGVHQFIQHYMNHLLPNGKIIITTPNPFNIRQFIDILIFGQPSVNPEHTAWIDPTNFIEITQRLRLKIDSFYWLGEYSKPKKWYRKLLFYSVYPFFYKLRRFYAPNYMIILTYEA
jgi:SAM-dependent methyltransferase